MEVRVGSGGCIWADWEIATPGTSDLGVDGTTMAFRGLVVKGSLVGSMYDTYMALDLARRGEKRYCC